MAMPAIRRRWTASAVRDLIQTWNSWPRYETIDGELLVTPSPAWPHQLAITRLITSLGEYSERERIGIAFVSPADLELEPDSIVQPDIFVVPRATAEVDNPSWANVKSLLLAVEVLSPSSLRADRIIKRDFYMEHGVAEYWIVDGAARVFERWTPTQETPAVERTGVEWWPEGASRPFVLDVPKFFGDVNRRGAASPDEES